MSCSASDRCDAIAIERRVKDGPDIKAKKYESDESMVNAGTLLKRIPHMGEITAIELIRQVNGIVSSLLCFDMNLGLAGESFELDVLHV